MILKDQLERLGGQIKRAIATLLTARVGQGVHLVVPHRMQMDGYSCGLCSARMVAEYQGVNISPATAATFAHRYSQGTYTTPLVQLLRDDGLVVRPYYAGQASSKTLVRALTHSSPVIVSFTEHYLVITGFDRHFFYVNDPAPFARLSGRITRRQFQKFWTREAIIVLGRRQ